MMTGTLVAAPPELVIAEHLGQNLSSIFAAWLSSMLGGHWD